MTNFSGLGVFRKHNGLQGIAIGARNHRSVGENGDGNKVVAVHGQGQADAGSLQAVAFQRLGNVKHFAQDARAGFPILTRFYRWPIIIVEARVLRVGQVGVKFPVVEGLRHTGMEAVEQNLEGIR